MGPLGRPSGDFLTRFRQAVGNTRFEGVLIERRQLVGGVRNGAWQGASTTTGRVMVQGSYTTPFQTPNTAVVNAAEQQPRMIELDPAATVLEGDRLTLAGVQYIVLDVGGLSSFAVGRVCTVQEQEA